MGIPKHTKEGKVDFHACTVAYISPLFEAGASPKEALGRHSTPDLTLNTYARAREDRLSKLTEAVGERVRPSEKCAIYVPAKRKRNSAPKSNSFDNNELKLDKGTGGGGIRTPVPRCFKASVYMLSRYIVFFTLPSAKTTGSWLSYFG